MNQEIIPGSVMESILVSLVKDNWEYIQHIESPTETIQLAAISSNPMAIFLISEPTTAALHQAVIMKPELFEELDFDEDEEWKNEMELIARIARKELSVSDIENPTPRCMWTAVYYDPMCIKDIKNPPKHIQLLAASLNGYTIEYMPHSDIEVQLTAVRENAFAIQCIANPCKEVQLEAVKSNGFVIKSITNPDEDAQIMAVNDMPELILDIHNPCNLAQLVAVAKKVEVFAELSNPDDNIKLLAVQKDGMMIQYVDNPTINLQLAAILQNPNAINKIQQPSEAAKITAVKKVPELIEHVFDLEESTQRAIIENNPSLYESYKDKFPLIQKSEVDILLKKNKKNQRVVYSLGKEKSKNLGTCFNIQWKSEDTFEANIAALMVHSDGMCHSRGDVVYLSNTSADGVKFSLTTNDDDGYEQIQIIPELIPDDVDKIIIVGTVFQANKRNQTFGTAQEASIRYFQDGAEVVNLNLAKDYSGATGIVAFEMNRRNGKWVVTIKANVFWDGLKAICNRYGIF